MDEQAELDVREARERFIKDRYAMVTTGIDIEAVGEHYSKCVLKLDERHVNGTGQVMGGAIFTLADFSFAVATNFRQSVTVTTVSQICFLGVAKGDTLYAECNLVKDGKRSCFYEIRVTDNLGNAVALVTSQGTHLNIPQNL